MFYSQIKKIVLALVLSLFMVGSAIASKEIKFASVSWTGVTIKTELGVDILNTIGYEASNVMLSVPIVYKAMSIGDADIFLGNWMPSMKNIADKYFNEGSVIKYIANMPGAKYTLAVPSYVYEGGLQSFSDIAKYADKLENKIYGIEEGNDGNEVIQTMIDKNMFDLGKFELIASSEAGMLSEVKSFGRNKRWIVFLGWAPHYMNEIIDMKYLKGSTPATFGANDGTATVYTNVRKGFLQEQPNIALFLKNLVFPVSMMNQIMDNMHKNSDLKPLEAGLKWLKANPAIYQGWLKGVKTADGKPALPVFEKRMSQVD